MRKVVGVVGVLSLFVMLAGCALFEMKKPRPAEVPKTTPAEAKRTTPADGHEIHVVAPHVVDGKVRGPFHHYCKVLSPEPIIECLIYESTEPNAKLTEIEYIVAKTLTRTELVPLTVWNKNWHDHEQEISTGRVQVLDLPADKAKEVADLVAKTDGIIFHLWPHGAKLPNGTATIAQSVGHVDRKPEGKKK